MRWVLGEQSYSLLRGRKTEDMIFAGSEQRARASMASATITFDNEDNWLPIDYSEVAITRRAYRDGQNEYLLNGQRVRLKEISELLAQSGLAERTYTIIGQGLVDAALSLKPEERRRFFEEAAGIGLYRVRRDESLNRLETTQRNLERVQDILGELEPRLQSLEKQARRAQEYERIKADLNLLLRDWYGYHWHRAQQELVHSRQVFTVQEERQQAARQQQMDVDEKVNNLRSRLQTLRSNLNQWHTDSSNLHRQREKISRDLAVLDERQRALLEQQQSMQNNCTNLESEQHSRQERLAILQEEITRLQTELGDAQNQLSEARRNLEQRQAEREKVEKKLLETRQKLIEVETRFVQLKAHQAELTNRAISHRNSIQSILENLQREEDTVRKAQIHLNEVLQQRVEVENKVNELDEEIIAQREQITSLENNRKAAIETRNKLEGEATRLHARLDILEQAEKSFTGLNQGARFLLESSNQGRLQGGYQAFSSLLNVPAQIDTAIAAVLGEYLDSVLLNTQADPEEALLLLESGEKGRAVLIPLSYTYSGEHLKIPSGHKNIVGIAASLIDAPDHLRPLLDQLLGQVLIVNERNTARQLAAELPASARIVTLKGEVFHGNGFIIAGQDGRSNLIARPRQKQELRTELSTTEDELSTYNKHIHELDQRLSIQLADLRKLEENHRKAIELTSQTIQAYTQANLEFEKVRQRFELQQQQLSDLKLQLEYTEKELQESITTQEKLGKEINEVNELVRQYNRELNCLPLDEVQRGLAYWTTNVAVLTQAGQDSVKRLEELQGILKAYEDQFLDILQRMEESAIFLSQLNSERDVLRTTEAELNRQIDSLQQQIAPAEQLLESEEQEFSILQSKQVAAQQAMTVAERYLAQAQLELTRQREGLTTLRKRIEDDFGLVVFEYNEQVSGQTPLPLGDMVAELPRVERMPPDLEENINRHRTLLRRMGAINPEAQAEYQSVRQRYEFMTAQVQDLKKADADLRQVIAELDDLMRKEFRKTFEAVATEFHTMFHRLFNGGSARLTLQDEENLTETGIDIEARLPGRREQGLSLLSGGERSLTAVALIFSLLKVSPTPFCVMDEVDAMLDEANVGRFCELLKELSSTTQFILITHNRNTVQTSGVIYGVTMGRDSASQIISLRLDEVSEEMAR